MHIRTRNNLIYVGDKNVGVTRGSMGVYELYVEKITNNDPAVWTLYEGSEADCLDKLNAIHGALLMETKIYDAR